MPKQIQKKEPEFTLTKEIVRQYICPKCSDEEIAYFLMVCKATKLDPIKGEIYLVKYDETQPAGIVISYLEYIKRGARNPNYQGFRCEEEYDENGKLIGAVCTIYRKDWKEPFIWKVSFDENVKRRRDGKPTKFWATQPGFQIRKVAIAQAFRLAFPEEAGELPAAEVEVPVEEVAKPIESIESIESKPEYTIEMPEMPPKEKEQPKIEPEPKPEEPKPESKVEPEPEFITQDIAEEAEAKLKELEARGNVKVEELYNWINEYRDKIEGHPREEELISYWQRLYKVAEGH